MLYALMLLHQRVRHLEIGVDVLHVVVLVERLDQLEQLLALLVVDRDGVLRLPGERRPCAARRTSPPSALATSPSVILRGVDFVSGLARDHVLGAGLDRRLQHRVGARRLGVVLDHADMVEHERRPRRSRPGCRRSW